MYVICSFEHSVELELAITDLEKIGIGKDSLFAVPLNQKVEANPLFDTFHRTDGLSLFDAGAVLGTVGAVLGATYGFAWTWGPIIWGLIGLLAGFLAGFAIDLAYTKKRKTRTVKSKTEVVLIIRCEERLEEHVKKILWGRRAIGLGIAKHV